jgi:hypothetical protein
MLKKAESDSLATALASMVFPFPGGPKSRRPLREKTNSQSKGRGEVGMGTGRYFCPCWLGEVMVGAGSSVCRGICISTLELWLVRAVVIERGLKLPVSTP